MFPNILFHLSSGWSEPVDLGVSDSGLQVLADDTHGVWTVPGDHSLQN